MIMLRKIICIIFLLLLFSCSDSPKYFEHLSDDDMIKIFNMKKDSLITLINMLEEDKVIEYIFVNWSKPRNLEEKGISKSRIKAYRSIFKKVGLKGIYRRDYGDELVLSAEGMLENSTFKGFFYSQEELQNVVESLDDYEVKKDKKYSKAFRKIGNGWYLIYRGNLPRKK